MKLQWVGGLSSHIPRAGSAPALNNEYDNGARSQARGAWVHEEFQERHLRCSGQVKAVNHACKALCYIIMHTIKVLGARLVTMKERCMLSVRSKISNHERKMHAYMLSHLVAYKYLGQFQY